jgi:hypothetical protein
MADATSAQAEQVQRWRHACATLHTLPAHSRFSQLPANLHCVLQRVTAVKPNPEHTAAIVPGRECNGVAVGTNPATVANATNLSSRARPQDEMNPLSRFGDPSESPASINAAGVPAAATQHDRIAAPGLLTPDLTANTHSTSTAPVVVQIALHAPDAHFTKTQTLVAATSHTLTQLKDAIDCMNDRYAMHELKGTAPLTGGIFFLGGVLYEDTRCKGKEGYVDYLPHLIKFFEARAQDTRAETGELLRQKGFVDLADVAANQPGPVQPKIHRMQEARIVDLEIAVAQTGRYLYMHAGACEHFLVFEDVRIAHVDDPDLSTGPQTVFRLPQVLEKCCICCVRPAVTVTFEDVLAPESPAFFCALCFDDLHRDAAGGLLPGNECVDTFALY